MLCAIVGWRAAIPISSPTISFRRVARGPEKHTLPYSKANLSTQAYDRLLHFWQLHTSLSEPDQQRLRKLHDALCLLELLLHHERLDECMENLHKRLQYAQQLDMYLPLPSWAAHRVEQLEDWVQENVQQEEQP